MSARIAAAARLAAGLALAVAAGEATGAAVCSATPGANDWIACVATTAADLSVSTSNVVISTTGNREAGVSLSNTYSSWAQGESADVSIRMTGGSVSTTGRFARGVYAWMSHSTSVGDVTIDLTRVAISATGVLSGVRSSHNGKGAQTIRMTGGSVEANRAGVYARHTGEGAQTIELSGGATVLSTGNPDNPAGVQAWRTGKGAQTIKLSGGVSVSATGSPGVQAWHTGEGAQTIELSGGTTVSSTGNHGVHALFYGPGTQTIRMTGGRVEAQAEHAHAVYANPGGSAGHAVDLTLDLSGVAVSAMGDHAHGVVSWHSSEGAHDVDVTGGSITTTGAYGTGLYAHHPRHTGKLTIDVDGGATIETRGHHGIYANASTPEGTTITLSEVSIVTRGSREAAGSRIAAVYGQRTGPRGDDGETGDLVIDLTEATLTATPTALVGRGVFARDDGVGDIRVHFRSGRIRTGAVNGLGLEAWQGFADSAQGGTVENHGNWPDDTGVGSIVMTIGAEGRIEAPFSVGVSGILGNPKVGTGRLVVEHAGKIEARNGGIVALAPRWSGSTFGEGIQATTDDAARTMPMIHVTSSGDITVGAGVMDDFIRTVVAGDDGTLSTAEQSVLDAIVEDDPVALDTALAALPASYTDDYEAEARALRANRRFIVARPATEADEALGLPKAGIRALVNSHNHVAGYIGFLDREREILRAVLAGGEGLEPLLAALPAAYTDDWKDEVRRLALLYNEGDVRVDVTGGTIVSEGHGIDARYAVRHERNGAIEVSVAEGASVTGGAAGVYVAGAGLGDVAMDSDWGRSLELEEDVTGLRRQFVTVHGMVTGGTDAAVHLAGGGVLHVGPTGKVHAGSSGVGVLVNDPGTAHILIEGEVKGAEGGAAAVHLTGGGSVRVGETGRVLANGADRAIRTDDPPGDTPMARVTLLVGATPGVEGGVSSEDAQSLRDRVEGSIGAGSTADGSPGNVRVVVALADGTGRTLESAIGPDGTVVLDPGDFPCPPGQFRDEAGGECRPPCPEGRTRGDDGECPAPPPPPCPAGQARGDDGECPAPPPPKPVMRGFDCGEAVDTRCRLYEALPSILLSMNGLPTWEERMSAARDARGGWARVEVADGKWKADHSTRPNVAYDHRRHGLRVGTDFAVGAARGVGVSLHGLRGSAEMAQGGEVDLSGYGLGVHATMAFADGFHADAQATMTWYEADLESARADLGVLKKGVDGRGHALGVEVGRRMGLRDGVSVTPRVGLTWSTVDLDDFADGAARVSVEDARSLKGRVGVGVEKALDGDGMDGSRLFGSLDLEREFEEETETRVSGMSPGSSVTSLKAKAERTAYRLAVGGARVWGEGRYSLRGSVGYTGSGGDNRDLGGGLSFSLRF